MSTKQFTNSEPRVDWRVYRSTEEDVQVGDSVVFSKTIDDDGVHAFAEVSGDTNPLHLDDGYAAESMFQDRIVHGMAVASTISAALARLPGVVIYLSQDLEFRNPTRVGDRVIASVEVVEDIGDDRYRLRTSVEDRDGRILVDGEAVVLIQEDGS